MLKFEAARYENKAVFEPMKPTSALNPQTSNLDISLNYDFAQKLRARFLNLPANKLKSELFLTLINQLK